MQTQRSINVSSTTEDDILMTSPFAMENTFDKESGGANLLSNIIQGDNCDDWSMDCDDDEEEEDHVSTHHHSNHRLIRRGKGMASHDSIGSIDSSSSTSSTQEHEPELSRSFGSTRSFDLMTPIKPNIPLHSLDPLQRYSQTKGFNASSTTPLPIGHSNTPMPVSPHSMNPSLLDLSDSIASSRHLNQQRNNLSESLGVTISEKIKAPGTIRAGKPAPPGLAGRLKINLPSSSSFSMPNAPQTPGGHIAVGARDGAADGGPPLSPFEPPTPLFGPIDSPFNGSKSASSSTTTTRSPPTASLRPKLQQRHTITPLRPETSSVMGMSPITSQFAAVSMRKASSSKGSTSDISMQRCDTFESSSTSSTSHSTSTLLTPPYSPFSSAKALPVELDVPSAVLERRTSASSTTSSSSSKKRNDVVRSSVSSRTKAVKSTNKVSPYPLTRDEVSTKSAQSIKIENNTTSSIAAAAAPPSLLKDIVKPPMAAPIMEKCISEPAPKTVSAKHLAHRNLHPTFSANYTLGDELGSGGFGFVVSATRNQDGMPVAVKFIWKDKVPSHGWVRDDEFGAIPMEAFVLKVVDSPFVVKFVDLFDDEQFFYLVMEHHGSPWKAPEVATAATSVEEKSTAIPTSSAMKVTKSMPNTTSLLSPTVAIFPPESDIPIIKDEECKSSDDSSSSSSSSAASLKPIRPAAMERRSSCDLFECIEQHSRLSEDKARWVFAQIVEAVYYLDKRGICHRDIKDENCVIDSDFNVKLIDFGSSVITDPRRPTPYFNRFFGTMTFASSEILQGKQYRAPHAEVWSLGVLLSILLSGECPFVDPTAAIKGKISRPNGSWSSEALNLLLACLVVNPDKRASIEQIRNHPWVAKAWLQRGRQRPHDSHVSYTASA